ncbi:DUF460 domain-containing protein [Candidatus Woesearchaeota archaeon]|nr:DUF460 domain-containing protein [Candidatus Woesearchaeota archaeon]
MQKSNETLKIEDFQQFGKQSFPKPLIIGIDPGTTVGYAILDIHGQPIAMHSSKQLNLSKLISTTIKFGKPVLVGSDVSPASHIIEKFATKTGSKLVQPEQDMSIREKNILTKDFKTKNTHQRDALASALFAYKNKKSLLDKTDRVLKKLNKQPLADKIKEIIIRKKISIKSALKLLETI